MKLEKIGIWLIIFSLILTLWPGSTAEAAKTDWITLPALQDIDPTNSFAVTFNKEVGIGDIDGIVIFHGGTFIPTEITVAGKQATIKPSRPLTPGTLYEMRIFIQDKRYKMDILTNSPSVTSELQYLGKKDVTSIYSDGQLVKGVNHYVADLKEGHPITIYVTDDYEARYGKGFAYEETVAIMKSIEAKRNEKPLTKPLGTLTIFFYTNESNTPLPRDVQAQIGSFNGNSSSGMPSEMLMNGSTMHYDFRTSYVHEFIHFFDFQSFMYEPGSYSAFSKYWGPNYQFWLIEGGAEYGGYFFYDYPTNTKNQLKKDFIKPTRESILAYAKAQGGNRKNLLFDVELDSFDDILKASTNNYGIALSLFWYLAEQYGYDTIYDYARFISTSFSGASTISQVEKDQTAKKFFTKTEKQILLDWLTYFNYFDGALQEYKETTTGTANYIFQEGDPLFPPSHAGDLGLLATGEYGFAVNITEWIPELGDPQARSFIDNSTLTFKLVAEGKESVVVKRTYGFYTGKLTNDKQLYANQFTISASEQKKLSKGTTYRLEPVGNDSVYKWVIPETLQFKW